MADSNLRERSETRSNFDRLSASITSNRAVDEWVALFDDPILANSALDRFAHRVHLITMDGPSLRADKAPGNLKGVAHPPRVR